MIRNLLMKSLMVTVATLCSYTSFAGNRYMYHFNINRPIDATAASVCGVKPTLVKNTLGVSTTQLPDLTLNATWTNSQGKETFYTVSTTGVSTEKGHWFTQSGMATTKEKNYCIKVVWAAPTFSVTHNTTANAEVGTTYTVKEALLTNKDTLIYVFNVTIGAAGSEESVTTDQPEMIGRKSATDGWLVRPMVQQNEQTPKYENFISVNAGDRITLGCRVLDVDTYTSAKYQWVKCYWDAKQKKDVTKTLRTYNSADFVLTESATYADGGMYKVTARLTDANDKVVAKSYYFYVDVQEHAGQFKEWPTYNLTYNFRSEYPKLDTPQKVHNIKKKNGQKANQYVGEWWSVFWGDDLNSEVGKDEATVMAAAKNLVEKYDYDFAYIRDYMGWPPDLSAREGYKSFVYIFGSGLSNDNTSKDEKGGYQSSTYVESISTHSGAASGYPRAER